jgi:hypothetical protein
VIENLQESIIFFEKIKRILSLSVEYNNIAAENAANAPKKR